MQIPWTGLGLYGGFRGNSWLKNRIKVFKQFVIPSLQAQTCKDFVLHCCWRREEKNNPLVKELVEYLKVIKEFKTVHTFHGILFYDDKYPDDVARDRLITSLHGTMGELIDVIGEVDEVYVSIQPSDDLYHRNTVQFIQSAFKENPELEAMGFTKGYICNYLTKEVSNYDPSTNPPFYTIRFSRENFVNPLKHIQYTALKYDVGKYKAGTPLPSHEYVKDCLKYGTINERGFCVGVHSVNISTNWNIPFKGAEVDPVVLKDFGVYEVPRLKIKISLGKKILLKLPYKVQRKLRYYRELI